MQPPLGPADLPSGVRLFPLPGVLLLPRAVLPLNIFEPRYLQMVRDAMAGDRMIAMIQPRNDSEPWELFDVGCVGRITQYSETGDGRYLIALTGVSRFRLGRELAVDTPYRQAEADFAPFSVDLDSDASLAAAQRADLESSLRHYLSLNDMSADWDAVSAADDESLVNTLATVCPFTPAERQAILEAPALPGRAATLSALMRLSEGNGDSAAVLQ